MENHIEIEETQQDKGFTLVALLIVLVILGILATVTVFAVTGITTRGKDSACKSDLKTIQTAEEAYNANTGDYGTEANLVAGGLLHDVSSNYDVAFTVGVAPALDTYTITVVSADCGTVGAVAN
jgi:general secretion pathway protein G